MDHTALYKNDTGVSGCFVIFLSLSLLVLDASLCETSREDGSPGLAHDFRDLYTGFL